MAIFKPTDLHLFTKQKNPQVSAILLFGPNEAKIKAAAKQIALTIVDSLDDPFSVDSLEEKQIKETPGLLRDEAMSLSFIGDSKVITIKDPGPASVKQIPDYLSVTDTQNVLIVEAGNLTKTAALRKIFEKAKNAACIAFYDDTPAELVSFVIQQFLQFGKTIDQSNSRALVESVGNHRGLIEQEIEKLLNFCGPNNEITLSDIEALSGDPLADSIETLCDAAILGQSADALKQIEQLALSGTQPAQILNVISIHLMRLLAMKAEQDKGQPIDNLIRYSRPPIFFKRQPIVKRQISSWRSSTLKNGQKIVFDAIAQTRKNPELALTVCERTILNLGRLSRAR